VLRGAGRGVSRAIIESCSVGAYKVSVCISPAFEGQVVERGLAQVQ